MAYYKAKVQIANEGNFIKIWNYSKPIVYGYDSDRIDYEKRVNGEKSIESLNRTRNNMIDLIESNVNHWSKFITLTLSVEYCQMERKKMIEKFKEFKKYYQRTFGKSLKYIGVMERQFKRQKKYDLEKAPWHIHLIVFNSQKLNFKQLKDCWRYGSVDLKKVDSKDNLSLYMAKYLTKDNVELNKKGFLRSQHLKKPTEIYLESNHSIPNKFTYHKTYLAYLSNEITPESIVQVDYYEIRNNKLYS